MNGHKNRHYYNAVKKPPIFYTAVCYIFVLFFLYPVIYMFYELSENREP